MMMFLQRKHVFLTMIRAALPAVLVCLLVIPGRAAAVAEIEPNDRDNEAMTVGPSVSIEATWSYARGKETRRGADRDTFRLEGFTVPGSYTITITPGIAECRYWAGLTNMRGPYSGEVRITVEVDAQKKATFLTTGGGQPDYRYSLFQTDPLNHALLITEPKLWNSDFQGGYQCVQNGKVYQELPYTVRISGGAAAGVKEQRPVQMRPVRAEIEPNDKEEEAMPLFPGDRIDGTWSYVRSRETRRGTDRDTYRLADFRVPGTYRFTVTPASSACKYWFGLTNFQGPFTGEVSLIVDVSDQKRVTTTYTGGGRQDIRSVTYGQDPLNGSYLILEPTFWNSDFQGGFQCVQNGPVSAEIPYRLTVSGSTDAQSSMTPAAAPLPAEISLEPNRTWEGEVAVSKMFELQARIAWDRAAGAASPLEVWINGQRVVAGLRNKAMRFQLADGREFPYFAGTVQAWTVFYSPDLTTNNTAAAGEYEVRTDPGQAYRYQWDIALLAGTSATMKVMLKHNGTVAAPVIIRFGTEKGK